MGLFEETETKTFEITLERIVFQNPDTGWTVARIRLDDTDFPATAVGRLLGVHVGERLRVSAGWIVDRKYGKQLEISSYVPLAPASMRGLERFLGSGLLPGVGKVMAKRIVERFGEEALEVLDNSPDQLLEVSGIGRKTADKISEAWQQQQQIRNAMIFLQGHEISAGFAAKVVKRFGADTVSIVQQNPYRLADEISGIGFNAADKVAQSLGWAAEADERIAGGILYALRQAAGSDGHLFLPLDDLVAATAELLGVDRERIQPVLPELSSQRQIVVDETAPETCRVYLAELHAAEVAIATHLDRLIRGRPTQVSIAVDRALEWFEESTNLELAPTQREAISRALETKVLILTGGPGTGKTTLVRAVVEVLSRKGLRVLLAAPTGRAANRLSEATGREVRTIHRLLEFDPHSLRFRRCADRQLEADLVVVDESSMIDAQLASSLLEAVADSTRLLIVGDADQLPSVGPGNVLASLIDSESVPVVRLQEIFRQKEADGIIVNAHLIHDGRRPVPDADESGNFFFVRRQQPEEILDLVLDFVVNRVPRRFGLDPRREVQVLSPMRRGILGTESLNERLRQLVNPGPRGDDLMTRWRIGDRIMQTRNNYDLDVFNGDIGFVAGVDKDDRRLAVDFDGRRVEFESADLDDLTLAYACTVHKSQGSEYPCVVLPLHTQHFMMLQRNLLYTAVTRAQRLMIIVGDQRAMDIALGNRRQLDRHTALAERIRALTPLRGATGL